MQFNFILNNEYRILKDKKVMVTRLAKSDNYKYKSSGGDGLYQGFTSFCLSQVVML